MCIVQPSDFDLNDTDSEYLKILQKAYPIIQSREEPEALQLIASLEGFKWRSQVERIYEDSKRLYDNFEVSKEMVKAVALKNLMIIAGDMQKKMHSFEDENAAARAGDVARKGWVDVLKFSGIANLEENGKIGALPIPIMQSLPVHNIYETAIIEDETQKDLSQ